MGYIHTDLKLLDPATGTFDDLDGGSQTTRILLLNILMELRVHTQYLQAMNIGIVNDDPAQMRIDTALDPSSLTPFTATSNF
jgi:hypothetical protein